MRVTTTDIRAMKARGERIAMVTAYDYTTARLVDAAGIHMILVGDSLGMVVLGYESTLPVTMDEMVHHTKAVCRGAKNALVVGDLPFMTYHTNAEDAMRNAARFIQEAGAQAVKLEGGVRVADTVRRIVDTGIPVVGHIGLTPQSVHQFGGFKVQGRSADAAGALLADARALAAAGAFAIVLEAVPKQLAKLITERVDVPTIGIGAGVHCDGQVQVISDMIGLFTDFVPRHAKQYAQLGEAIRNAVASYVGEVQSGAFPTDKQSFTMDEALLAELETK